MSVQYGKFNLDGKPADIQEMDRIRRLLAPYGPDGESCYSKHNLAVIYLSQQPPLLELARWHYQKALAAGVPKNPEWEKLFASRKASESGQ